MTSFTIQTDSNADEVARVLSRVGQRLNRQARRSAVSKTLQKTRTQNRRDIQKATGVSAKSIGKRHKVHGIKGNKKSGRLFVGTVPVRAMLLGAKQLKKGVSYKGPGGRVKKPSAFIARGRNNRKEHVFERKGRSRLPIKSLTVDIGRAARISANRLVNGGFMTQEFNKQFNARFDFYVNREIQRMKK